jgi:hypothetical protein
LAGRRHDAPEVALRQLRNKLRFAQVLVALLATLVSAVPDLRGIHGFKVAEIELFEPAERQATQETAAPLLRTSEDVEEFFGDGAPDARIRAMRLALSTGEHLRRCSESWSPFKRHVCANPPTGPPAV